MSERGITRRRLEIVTPERTPLAVFGAQASQQVADLLERSDIAVRTGVAPRAATDGALLLADGGSVPADRVVALPRSVGPRIPEPPAVRGVPNWCKTSMLPVSGALQLHASAAIFVRPIISASGA